ncbi:MAG: zinc-binding dehydrogenase [Bacteriovoracia bacterium]
MKAATITRNGGPGVFQMREIKPPTIVAGGIRIRVKACGVNFADLMMRMGLYPEAPKPPFVPGYEVAGTVTEVGPGVGVFRVGDRVMAACKFGGYTEEIVVPALVARKIPDAMSFEEAAAVVVNYMTAWVGLMDMARVRSGDRVLISSAAGGVGTAAVQLCKHAGAEVVGLVSSHAKDAYVKGLGADAVWEYDEWYAKKDERFSVVFDANGGKSLKLAFARLAPMGRVVSFGVSDMISGQKRNLFKTVAGLLQTPIFSQFKLQMQNKGVFGLNVLKFMDEPETLSGAFDGIMQGFQEGKYKVHVGKTFPLAHAGEAHTYLQSRKGTGKVVLIT